MTFIIHENEMFENCFNKSINSTFVRFNFLTIIIYEFSCTRVLIKRL